MEPEEPLEWVPVGYTSKAATSTLFTRKFSRSVSKFISDMIVQPRSVALFGPKNLRSRHGCFFAIYESRPTQSVNIFSKDGRLKRVI